ncbi:MAG: hypothetical protein ACI90V_011806 [Bacillariaceae sp.]|jgi:hypothetical protein
MAPMNAIAIMKRLREEKKAKDKEEEQKSDGSVGQNKDPSSVSKPPPSALGVVARTKYVTADSPVTEMQRHQCLSNTTTNNNNELWVNESLFERSVKIETTSGGGGRGGRGGSGSCTTSNTININLLEDPIGHFAGGNGATLWDCSIALTNVLAERYNNDNNNANNNENDRRSGSDRVINVLELGSGLGLVGIAMASSMGVNVLVTDRLIAVPLLKRNVEHNKNVIINGGGNVEVAELTWGKDQTKALLKAERRKRKTSSSSSSSSTSTSPGGAPATPAPLFNIVIMSDLIFPSNSDNYSLLVDTLVVLLFDDRQKKDDNNNNKNKSNIKDDNTNTTTPTIIDIWLSVEPRRIDVEAKFWSMLNDKGIYAHRLETSNLPSSHPDDIHIYMLSTNEGKENL